MRQVPMLLFILGIIDIFAGIVLALSGFVPLAGVSFILFIGILYLLKGTYSTGTAAANGFYFDLLGWFDLAAGLFFVLTFIGLNMGIFFFLGITVMLKGLYSFAVSIFKA
ncbi:MAG: hypothetical protein ABIF08_01910 [Nanoarchaeota archaeon]